MFFRVLSAIVIVNLVLPCWVDAQTGMNTDLANFMKERGKSLQIYWDDFKLYGK